MGAQLVLARGYPTLSDTFGHAPQDASPIILSERYRLLHKIGDGGMGRVYAAEHVTLGRRLAVKILRDELSRDPGNVERFLLEAQAASMIDHVNVVDIIDFGRTPSGSVFFAM